MQDVENQAGITVNAAIDALGDRLASGTSSAYAWLIPDLHGNVVGQLNSSGSTVTDAFRYDAYGLTEGTPLTGFIPSPWRFQGKLLESTSGGRDLYDFVARSYSPDIGAFTQLDSVAGSATNPVTLDRYLYAAGNPETLIDPDGHCYGASGDVYAGQHGNGACPTTSRYAGGGAAASVAKATKVADAERAHSQWTRKHIIMNDGPDARAEDAGRQHRLGLDAPQWDETYWPTLSVYLSMSQTQRDEWEQYWGPLALAVLLNSGDDSLANPVIYAAASHWYINEFHQDFPQPSHFVSSSAAIQASYSTNGDVRAFAWVALGVGNLYASSGGGAESGDHGTGDLPVSADEMPESQGVSAFAADTGADSAIAGRDLARELALEQQMGESGIPIAGPGSGYVLHDADRLAAEYGGDPNDWVKMTSTSWTGPDGYQFQTHWYENPVLGLRVEFKIKTPW